MDYMKADCIFEAHNNKTWPLTFAEEQMAVEQGMDPESVAYNINKAFRIKGNVQVLEVEEALNKLLKRQPVLRSYFPMEDGAITHKCADCYNISLETIKCNEHEVENEIRCRNIPFDLANGRLVRAVLFCVGDDEYILNFTLHHIIIDKTSFDVFVSDFFGFLDNAELPDLGFTYFDKETRYENEVENEKAERGILGLFPEGLPENEMPTVPIRPNKLPVINREILKKISTSEVHKASKAFVVTNYEFLLGVLGLVLGKYCGSESVVIGTAMSGRIRKVQEDVIGMFVNEVPVPMKPVGNMKLGDYYDSVRETVSVLKENQIYPFAKVVETLASDRNSSRNPVFDLMFNYIREPKLPKLDRKDLEVANVELSGQQLAMDIQFEIIKYGSTYNIYLSYSDELYEEEVMENFMEQFLCTLERVSKAASPKEMLVVDAAELPEKQISQLLIDFRGDRVEEGFGETILSRFKSQVEKTPDETAVVFADERLTYRQLDEKANALASHLKELGEDKVIGIMLHRSIQYPISTIAVMKIGAAYLPMDPEYPSERLEYMCKDAGVNTVIGHEDLFGKIPGFEGRCIDISILESLPSCRDDFAGPTPEDLFILLYTSGTTGKPKGVMLLNKNIANFCTYYKDKVGLKTGERVLAYASFGFDANMLDMYPTLTSGATLHIIPEEMRLDINGMAEYVESNNITAAFMTTQLGRQFVELKDPKSLKKFAVGGETLTPIEPPRFDFYNLYGPTECTVASNCFTVDKLYDRVPIGKPVYNTDIHVIDKYGRLAPVGVAGELCIAGIQVSKGYLNREDLTAEKFVENPFNSEGDFSRMYKSGDVVRYLPSGDIDFVGRKDFQVKIRGFRIELTEIEGRIREYEGITNAVVLAVDNAAGGKRVVAYFEASIDVAVEDLNRFIEEKLPSYMVPSGSMQLERIPLNQNGKVNRKELPEIKIKAEEMVPPVSQMEKKIHEIISLIIGTTEFGITTDLMYAGLNSLSSIKAAALISDETGKKLSTLDLMREKTITKIIKLLEGLDSLEKASYEKRDKYPLTENQLGLYFAYAKDPESLAYNIPIDFCFGENIDENRLKESILRAVDAHSYIKTNFEMDGKEPVQVPREDREIEIPIIKCAKDEYEVIKKLFTRPFNIFVGPLFRVEIVNVEGSTYVLMDAHHIIMDGGSIEILLRDIVAAYNGKEIEKETFTSFDLALREENIITSKEYSAAKEFYHERLMDCEGATIIPSDKDGIESPTAKIVTASISKDKIEKESITSGIRPSNIFLGALTIVASRLAATKTGRIATITNGRDGIETQNNLGMLVKTLPFAIDTGKQNSKIFLGKVQEEMEKTMQNQAFSYVHVSAEYNFNAQILYAYQVGVLTSYMAGDNIVKMGETTRQDLKFPITINLLDDEDNFIVELVYDNSKFTEELMQTMADSVAVVAENLLSSQSRDITSISILTSKQEQKIASFNKDIVETKEKSLHSIFEKWAEKAESATALICNGKGLTYKEVNEKANSVANALIDLGVKKEDRVAFILPRTENILISMLGIMKAGCAYIPVDPDYPEDRINHVLDDSGAKYIITDGTRLLRGAVSIESLLQNNNINNPEVDINGENLCYIIYTSGSTGKPKGVMLTHENIINYVQDRPENVHVRALVENQCKMVSVTTVSFDMFLKEAFTTLMNGLTLILANDEEAKNPLELVKLFKETGGDAFNATPSRMLQYMELPEIKEAFKSCKVIMAGGEGYPASLFNKLREVTDAALINTYGPTEITVSSNGEILPCDDITVGAPLFNVKEQVMDIYGNPLPAHVTGELWIGGTGVARGYFGNEKMTAERFVTYSGSRYYKSGDLAKFTADGKVKILGRNDGQIKLRGLRIELGEIEKALGEITEIKSAVVMVRKINKTEHLCAYYTSSMDLAPEKLREELLKTLTLYMVPTAYLQLDKMPMTPNGKIDRKALPEARLMDQGEYVAPETEEEKIYCEIFQNILQLEKVGAMDNFFDLGGTSLLVTQVTIDAAAKGYEVNYGDVFANPSPRELAGMETAKEDNSLEEIENFDYSKIDELLKENNIDVIKNDKYRNLGNICITGATGFLGIHVLKEFLETEKGLAYCVVRGGKIPAKSRLKSMLVYYFSNSYEELFDRRIIVIDGDVTNKLMFEKLKAMPIDTFFNCAANVKHFSSGTDIEDVNVTGAANCAEFSKQKECTFIQISTASVGGMSIDNLELENIKLSERKLYFGQDLSNKYVNSKFIAERNTLEMAIEGLDCKIMRVGNLMAREEDGEFQVNFNTNNFLGTLKAFNIVGMIPYENMGGTTEFAPIDCTAQAILILAKTPSKARVFHPYNDHDIYIADVIKSLNEVGVEIRPSEREEFTEECRLAMLDKNKAIMLNSLIAYQEHGKRVVPIKSTNDFTSQALLRQGFTWPITTPTYMKKFFTSVKELGFFDEGYNR